MAAKISDKPKSVKPSPNLAPRHRVDTKSRNATAKSVISNSNILMSRRNSKKVSDNCSKLKSPPANVPVEITEVQKSEIGVQVDEVEIIANDCQREGNEIGDAHNVRLPSPKVIYEIEKDRQQNKEHHLKALLNETRQFEKYAAKQEIHLTNLKEYLDTGVITKKRVENCDDSVEKSYRATSDETMKALGSYDRIKRKEEELIKLFNSI